VRALDDESAQRAVEAPDDGLISATDDAALVDQIRE
jgi:hypothetical protein